ncbi:thiamine pyrophosphokinase [Orenia metallireducens]|uniref:Thiamine diphosphokinase n=1 Tax=Orenia metallireducens TaxID=1413210 RepID=A0A1C0A819_9FIRM|nr:thiamine diphosphokinase [Orenia metallireducens]OCL26405.1 thiamine pyrophosphokinase [Orenia metallireducens]
MERVILFINGELIGEDDFYLNYIKKTDKVVCADGGANHAYRLGILPNLILGDLDSISSEALEHYQNQQVEFDKYPIAKDKTDTQLILEQLVTLGAKEIIIFAGLGGRLDHTLANLYLLEFFAEFDTKIRFVSPKERIELVCKEKILINEVNKTLSLLPLSNEVTGVYLEGFKYGLENATFKQGDTLGLSNIVIASPARIKLASGKLLMIIND